MTPLFILLIVSVIGTGFGIWHSYTNPSGRNHSRNFNRIHGKWRVKYHDGNLSEPMCRDVAEDYASMFGGTVIPKD